MRQEERERENITLKRDSSVSRVIRLDLLLPLHAEREISKLEPATLLYRQPYAACRVTMTLMIVIRIYDISIGLGRIDKSS